MHEFSLMNDLMKKINKIASQENAVKVTAVRVTLGAFSHISPEHFLEHFLQSTQGTITEGAKLIITVSTDTSDPLAQEIVLESIDVE